MAGELDALVAAARGAPWPGELASFLAPSEGRPVVRAMLGGARADRLGFAFVGAYRAALDALVPERPPGITLAALCATEAGGNHPRAIHTTLEGGLLRGHKTWVTLGGAAETLLVVARLPVEGDRPQLVLCAVPADAAGVAVRPLPELPFVPEVPHAEAIFDGAQPTHVFPGDGYSRYLKPFRTVEDLHVQAAFLGYALRAAFAGQRPDALEQVLMLASATLTLADLDVRSPSTHVALAGLLAGSARLVTDHAPMFETFDPRFPRDRALFAVAGKARALRLEAALRALVVPCGPP